MKEGTAGPMNLFLQAYPVFYAVVWSSIITSAAKFSPFHPHGPEFYQWISPVVAMFLLLFLPAGFFILAINDVATFAGDPPVWNWGLWLLTMMYGAPPFGCYQLWLAVAQRWALTDRPEILEGETIVWVLFSLGFWFLPTAVCLGRLCLNRRTPLGLW